MKQAKRYGPRSVPRFVSTVGDPFEVTRHITDLRRSHGLRVSVTPGANLRAILEGAPSGVVILLGEGTFEVQSGINIAKTITLVGCGRGTSLIVHDLIKVTAADCEIASMSIEQKSASAPALELSGADVTVHDLYVLGANGSHAIHVLDACDRGLFNRLSFATTAAPAAGKSDIYFESNSTNHAVSNVTSTQTRAHTMRYDGATATVAYAAIVGSVSAV